VQTFKLIPFPTNNLPDIGIVGEIIRFGNKFLLHYEVNGEIGQILQSAKSSSPSRTEDLCKATCFEFFIAIPARPQYWEFNMSPSGDWNVHRMMFHKIGFHKETAFTELPFVYRKSEDKLFLDISVDLSPILRPKQKVQLGVATIIQMKDGNKTYWALAHSGSQVDFRSRDDFILLV